MFFIFNLYDVIDLNFSFVHNWLKALKAQPHGSIDLPNGANILVDITTSALQAHIKYGKTVALQLGLHAPTKVQLEYLIKDNRFKLEIVGPVARELGQSANKQVMVRSRDTNNASFEKTSEDENESGYETSEDENEDGDDSSNDLNGIDDGDDNSGNGVKSQDGNETDDDWLHHNHHPDCYQDLDWETRVTTTMVRKKNS
jgi:hypothetical protein